jgi:hypothetical protein
MSTIRYIATCIVTLLITPLLLPLVMIGQVVLFFKLYKLVRHKQSQHTTHNEKIITEVEPCTQSGQTVTGVTYKM